MLERGRGDGASEAVRAAREFGIDLAAHRATILRCEDPRAGGARRSVSSLPTSRMRSSMGGVPTSRAFLVAELATSAGRLSWRGRRETAASSERRVTHAQCSTVRVSMDASRPSSRTRLVARTVGSSRRTRRSTGWSRSSPGGCSARAEPEAGSRASVRASLQRLGNRAEKDLDVEPEREVLDVVVVPLDAVGDRRLAAEPVDLCPARDARLRPRAARRSAGRARGSTRRSPGAPAGGRRGSSRPSARSTSCGSSSSDHFRRNVPTRVLRSSPSTPPGATSGSKRSSCAVVLGRVHHRPELEHVEAPAVQAHAILPVEDRPAERERDGEGEHEQERREERRGVRARRDGRSRT